MSKQISLAGEYIKGVWKNNAVLKQLLGLCPALAVTTSAENGIAMALATTFVLVFSSTIISTIRKLIPTQVRIASYIVVIATFVTIVDIVMKAKFPELSKSLGPYIPLIVVNCLILGRQEAFSSKNNPIRSIFDALGAGTGFLVALATLGGVREILGSGKLLGMTVLPEAVFTPWLVMILPAGAFLTLGIILGIANIFEQRKEDAAKAKEMKEALERQRSTKLKAKEAV